MKIAFWIYVWILTLTAVSIAFRGIGYAKDGDFQKHKRLLDWSIRLILFFVATYVLKLVFLGREALSTWESHYVIVLRVHESFIGIMLISGTLARLWARKFQARLEAPSADDLVLRGKHARAGKICITAATLGLVTATYIIWGMIQRA